MSSRSVQIIGGEERQHAFVDGETNSLHVIGLGGSSTIQGVAFSAEHTEINVATEGIMDVLVRVGTNDILSWLAATVSVQMLVSLFENPTITSPGTPIIVINRDRTSATTTATTVEHTPTIAVTGTELLGSFVPGGTRSQAIGSSQQTQAPWKLKASTNYLLRLTNVGATPAYATLGLDFAEYGLLPS